MASIEKKVLFGNIIEETEYVATEYEPRIIFRDHTLLQLMSLLCSRMCSYSEAPEVVKQMF